MLRSRENVERMGQCVNYVRWYFEAKLMCPKRSWDRRLGALWLNRQKSFKDSRPPSRGGGNSYKTEEKEEAVWNIKEKKKKKKRKNKKKGRDDAQQSAGYSVKTR